MSLPGTLYRIVRGEGPKGSSRSALVSYPGGMGVKGRREPNEVFPRVSYTPEVFLVSLSVRGSLRRSTAR